MKTITRTVNTRWVVRTGARTLPLSFTVDAVPRQVRRAPRRDAERRLAIRTQSRAAWPQPSSLRWPREATTAAGRGTQPVRLDHAHGRGAHVGRARERHQHHFHESQHTAARPRPSSKTTGNLCTSPPAAVTEGITRTSAASKHALFCAQRHTRERATVGEPEPLRERPPLATQGPVAGDHEHPVPWHVRPDECVQEVREPLLLHETAEEQVNGLGPDAQLSRAALLRDSETSWRAGWIPMGMISTDGGFSAKKSVNRRFDRELTAEIARARRAVDRTTQEPTSGTRPQTSTSAACVVTTNGVPVSRVTHDATTACGVNQCAYMMTGLRRRTSRIVAMNSPRNRNGITAYSRGSSRSAGKMPRWASRSQDLGRM